MKHPRRLSARFFGLGLGTLLLALCSIGLTMWVTRQLDGAAAAVNEAVRMRMQSWRLVSLVQAERSPSEIEARVAELDATMQLLQQGDPQRPLFVPWNDETHARFSVLQQAWQDLRPAWTAPAARPPAQPLSEQVEAFVQGVDELVHAIEATLARLTAILNLFQFVMMALAVAAAVVMLYIGYLFVIQPLKRLQAGMRQVEKGDFSARVVAESHDEFGELAAGFNHMAATLHTLYHGLERTVEEKTRDLAAERTRLAALYEVSNFLVEAHTLEELAQGFAQKVRRISGADAVAVRWSDEAS